MNFLDKQKYRKFFKDSEFYDTELFNLLVKAAQKAEDEYYNYPDAYVYKVYQEYIEKHYEQLGEAYIPNVCGLLDHVDVIESGNDIGVYIWDTGMVSDIEANGSGVIKPEE